MPKRRTSTFLGGGLLLALTLALSGCGGGADESADSAPAAGDSAQLRTADAAVEAPAPGCTAPSPAPFATLNPTGPAQPWSLVTDYLQQNPLASDSVSGQVKLCKGCSQLAATLRPLANTCAISSKTGQTWLMGRVVANGPLSGANQSMFGPGNDSARVYLVTKARVAYVIYPKVVKGQLTIGYVPAVNPNTPRWNFITCPDTAHGDAAWGQYVGREAPPTCTPLGGDSLAHSSRSGMQVKAGEDPGEELLSYGWMACIGGCCRFYGPQPPYSEEEEEYGGQPGNSPPGNSPPGGGQPKGEKGNP